MKRSFSLVYLYPRLFLGKTHKINPFLPKPLRNITHSNNTIHSLRYFSTETQAQTQSTTVNETNIPLITTTTPSSPNPPAPPVNGTETNQNKVDLEIKDPAIIFSTVWNKLETKYTKENMRFPQEIIWLGGAPGAGKGTNTPFIASVRGITAEPIVMSSLLDNDEARKIKAAGGMVNDSFVFQTVLEELLKPEYRSGVVVDGFPRTPVQVECTNALYEKMIELRKLFFNTKIGHYFSRPVFRVTVLFVEEKQSVERQINRGQAIRETNKQRATQGLQLLEERETDLSEDAARKRYKIFRDHYNTLQVLKKHFPFTLIDASADIEEVQHNILREFRYQSSLELSQETYDLIQHVPIVSTVIAHARSDLVSRLDEYQFRYNSLFKNVISVIEREFVPSIKRHAIAGSALIRSENDIFNNPLAVEMALDVLSERGFHVVSDVRVMPIPDRLDPNTNLIISSFRNEYRFSVKFQRPQIRGTIELASALHGS